MPQYLVTATFDNVDEALRFLAHGAGNRGPIGATVERTDKPAPAPAKPKAEKPDPAPPAPAPAAAAPVPAPSVSAPPSASAPKAAEVDYTTLQKAVFKLAGIPGTGHRAATEMLAALGVKTFKDLDSSRWAEALFAVTAKTEELAVPA